MLSYDWLKILLTIVASVLVLAVLFTMIATRPTSAQTFTVFAYNGISAGGDWNALDDELTSNDVLSYDVLKTETETFSDSDSYSTAIFTAKRSVLEGSVMFVSNYSEPDEEGNEMLTPLDKVVDQGLTYQDGQLEVGLFRYPDVFLQDCRNYLAGFFGENLDGDPDMDAVRACFLARNGGDKRYRSAEKKEEGVLSERARLVKLRADYLAVIAAFEAGQLSYTTVTEQSKEFVVGINIGKLNTISNLVYYTKSDSDVHERDMLNLVIFNNGEKDGMSDLKYEAVSFLGYLIGKYGK